MHFNMPDFFIFVVALVLLGASIVAKPKAGGLIRIDPVASRASGIFIAAFYVVWPIAVALGTRLEFKQVAYPALTICFSILLWGWVRARAV